jgi:transposase
MLKPGLGRTHRAYLWSYSTTQYDPMPAVVYDFADSRSGQHARTFLTGWSGKLICDDYSGYKALFERGVVEVGCMAHARRKFHELHENHRSQIAADALVFFAALYDVETRAHEQKLDAVGRQKLRQLCAKPIADSLRKWLILHRQKVPDGSATARAIEYGLRRWEALTRYLDDGDLPIDNNWIENRIRPKSRPRQQRKVSSRTATVRSQYDCNERHSRE